MALSIPPERIHIHPDNLPIDQQEEARRHFGEVLIGIPVSPFPEYINAQLEIIIREIEDEVTKRLIPRLEDCPQLLHYFSKHILPHKFTHLLRGLPPEFSVQLTHCLTRLQRLILEQLFMRVVVMCGPKTSRTALMRHRSSLHLQTSRKPTRDLPRQSSG